MTPPSDRDLLDQFVRSANHDAFAELVRRYVRLVRSAALRQTRDTALADDVTQAAMIVLARRACEIPRHVVLASWLFTVTHQIALNAARSSARRTHHERTAAALRSDVHIAPEISRMEIDDELDAAIARLPEVERGGIVLHYLNSCTYEQVGEALGVSAEAARKRVQRGLDRLRERLVGRGVTMTSAELATSLCSVGATESPSSTFVASTTNVALFSITEAAKQMSRAGMLADTMTRSLWTLPIKLAACVVLAITVSGIAVARHTSIAPPATSAQPATQPTTQPDPFAIDITKDVRLELLGLCEFPGREDGWFRFDGEPIAMPDPKLSDDNVNTDGHPDHQVALRLRAPGDAAWMMSIDGATTMSVSIDDAEGGGKLCRGRFALDGTRITLELVFTVATTPVKTVAKFDAPTEETEINAGDFGIIHAFPAEHSDRWGTFVNIRYPDRRIMAWLIATDEKGQEHKHKMINTDDVAPGERQAMFIFDLAPDRIKSLRLDTREFDKEVRISDISLESGNHTEPKITVKDITAGK